MSGTDTGTSTTATPDAEASGAHPGRPVDADRGDGDRRGTLLALLAVLAVATVVRVVRLGDDSLWDNEILSFNRATAPVGDAYDLVREGTHPPLYSQVVLRPWLNLGESEFMQRIPSAVFGVATVVVTYLLGARVAGRRTGLLAAVLLTVLPLHLYYSREGRMYAVLALLTTLWVAALLRAHRTDTWGAWTLYALLGAAALYTHYYAGFAVMSVVAVTGATYVVTRSSHWKRWLVATAGIGVLFAPWLPTFWYQLGNDPVSHLPALSLGRLLSLPIDVFTGFLDVPLAAQALIVAAIAVLTVLLIAALRRTAVEGSGDLFPFVVMGGAVVGTFLLSVLVSVITPVIFVRYFVGILPLCCILLAVGAVRARPAWLGTAAAAVLLVVSVASSVPVLTDSWRPDFAGATARIAADGPEGTIVVLVGSDDIGATGFDHYHDPDIPVLRVDAVGEETANALADLDTSVSSIWIVQSRPAGPTDPPPGFETTLTERYETRFFDRDFTITLTRLEPVP